MASPAVKESNAAVFRPRPTVQYLKESSALIRRTVNHLLSKADEKVLLSDLMATRTKAGLRLWALQMQRIHIAKWGNYLNYFFLTLMEKNPEFTKKMAIKILEEGIAISSYSGHFISLEHLDPNEPLPRNPSLEAMKVRRNKYIDNYATINYDLNYEPIEKGVLSSVLQLTFADKRKLDIDIRVISDNIDFAWGQSFAFAYTGPGDFLYPLRLTRNTTPRLWKAKHDLALATVENFNTDFGFFSQLATTAIFANLPIGMIGSPAPVVNSRISPRAIFAEAEAVPLQSAVGRVSPLSRGVGSRGISGSTGLPPGESILVVGPERISEFEKGLRLGGGTSEVFAVNPVKSDAVEAFIQNGGKFRQMTVQELPAGQTFKRILEEFPQPSGYSLPEQQQVQARLARLQQGGELKVLTEDFDIVRLYEEQAKVIGGRFSVTERLPGQFKSLPDYIEQKVLSGRIKKFFEIIVSR